MKLITGVMTAGLVAMAMAQSNTTVEVFDIGIHDPFFPPSAYLASVVEAKEKATTYHLQCAHGGRSWSFCPLPMPATYINGPSTANLKLIYNRTDHETAMRTTVSNDCQITPSALASCNMAQDVTTTFIPDTRGAETTPATTRRLSITKISTTSTHEGPTSTAVLTITAGKEKLSNTASASSSGMAESSSGTTESSSGMGAAVTAGTGSGIGLAAVGMAAAVLL